jgi:hypothetical protein
MSDRTRVVPVGPTTISPTNQKPESIGWPKWMQDAFSCEPETRNVQQVDRSDEPARGDPARERILRRVSPRS